MLPPSPLPRLPRRPALRPGVPVVRRDPQHLQIGLDPPQRVIVADEPGVRDLLAALRSHTTPALDTPESRDALVALVTANLVLDQARPASVTLQAQYGPDANRRQARRDRALVALRSDPGQRAMARALLSAHDLAVTDAADAADAAVSACLVLARGELARADLDDLLRRGTPHLVVSGNASRVQVGPLVVPGETACLRCRDAHLLEQDPRRPLLVEQAARAVRDGIPEPCDQALTALALGWAVRDLVRFVEGDRPTTYSATVTLGPADLPQREEWDRHPHCGCAWDVIGYG